MTAPTHITLDRLENADAHTPRHPLFDRAFAFLRRSDLAELPPGPYTIEGDRVFATVWAGSGRQRADAKLEAHRKFIDIQYIIAGPEEMGWKQIDACRDIAAPYRPDDDIIFYNDPPATWTPVPSGSFALFFPEDAHAPLVGSGDIHKVIVKVAVQP